MFNFQNKRRGRPLASRARESRRTPTAASTRRRLPKPTTLLKSKTSKTTMLRSMTTLLGKHFRIWLWSRSTGLLSSRWTGSASQARAREPLRSPRLLTLPETTMPPTHRTSSSRRKCKHQWSFKSCPSRQLRTTKASKTAPTGYSKAQAIYKKRQRIWTSTA